MELGYWGDTPANEELAKRVLLEVLCPVYPNHPWFVEMSGDQTGGCLRIRYLEYPGKYCQVLNHKKGEVAFYSWTELRRQVILAGGEWLERVGFARRRGEGYEPIKHIEGVPLAHQPIEYIKERMDAAAAAVAPETLRDKPHRPLQEKEKSWPKQTGSG